ncbi:MAG: TRAP transporter fused permease subunit [Betaproteobacteria bacterium]|nr:TRAP transporter fused permease subunit [Betaproteobacteria bacterium]
MTVLINLLAVILTLAALALSADLFRAVGISLYTEQFLAILLAIATPLLFLRAPANGTRERTGPVPWYDLVAAIVAAVGGVYLTVRFPELSELVSRHPAEGLIVAAVMLVLFLEGLRRTVGLELFLTTIAFIVLALVGGWLPGEFSARSIPLPRLTYYLIWDSTATLGVTMKIVATIVVVYVLFGHVLFKAGGAKFFTDIAMALMGRYRGGPAKVAILGSSLFGSISGNIVSNVMTVGAVTIPLMKRVGFRPHLAAAIEACASTAGQIMPPVMGVAAFIMAEYLQVPFYEVALAALIPAVLFYVALFIQVDLEAARSNIQPMDENEIPKLGKVLKEGWYFMLPFAVLVWALFFGNYEPEIAGLIAIAVMLGLGVVFPYEGKRLGWRDLYIMVRDTGTSVLDLFMLGVAAGVMIGALGYSGVGFTLTLVMVLVAGGSLIALLILSAIVNIILGLGLPTVGVYIVLATLVAPSLIKMGIDPMAAHMFIMYYGCLSMISPPVAIAAFVAANMAGADPNRTGWVAMAFGWTLFVIPFLFVFSTTLLMKGDPGSIALDFALACIGVWFISAAMMGYAVRTMTLVERLYYAVIGICIFMPASAFGVGRWINLTGIAAGVLLYWWERRRRLIALPRVT